MPKVISLDEAVGTKLAHDLTEIRPGQFKGPAFKRGHVVCDEDICHLQKMGKNHLYILDLDQGQIHEDEAVLILAEALAGPGVEYKPEPHEGKIVLTAAHDGLLKIDVPTLAAFNMIDEVMCASLHNNGLVKRGETIAATRAVPLVMDRAPVERAAALARQAGGLVSVKRLMRARAGLVITGNEVFHGLIEDKFADVLTAKLNGLGGTVENIIFAPDDEIMIAAGIHAHLEAGCNLILLSGGLSVDPDDVTRAGVRRAGAKEMHYGSAVLPGAMFLAAAIGDIPVLGVPACGMYHQVTVLDLVLPRVLAGEKVTKKDLALLGHGGLCRNCPECAYPACAFGKGI